MHMIGFTIEEGATLEECADAYVKRLDAVLSMVLPLHKVGIAHLTSHIMSRENWQEHLHLHEGCDVDRVLRPYRIAKVEGCKFYLG